MNRIYHLVLIVLLSLSLISCAGGPTSESAGQYFDSTLITAKIKTKLVSKLGFDVSHSIRIETYKDVVQLSGFVKSDSIKAEASDIAQVPGVRKVVNNLIVK